MTSRGETSSQVEGFLFTENFNEDAPGGEFNAGMNNQTFESKDHIQAPLDREPFD